LPARIFRTYFTSNLKLSMGQPTITSEQDSVKKLWEARRRVRGSFLSLDLLPYDIVVSEIIPWLLVEDVMALRRVC
jgi:hypothetical protein